ncbi:MAG: hypothetical protein LH615_15565 [Ferruginibacter sp.]|nr:hypothetical protein [Ferruginibacter sp.]
MTKTKKLFTIFYCAFLFTQNLIAQQNGYTYNTISKSIPLDNIYNSIDKKGLFFTTETKENVLIRYQQKGILSISNAAFQQRFCINRFSLVS